MGFGFQCLDEANIEGTACAYVYIHWTVYGLAMLACIN